MLQFFSTCLLVLLPANWPRFYFRAIGLIISLAIIGTILMALEIAIDLSRLFL